MTDVTAEQLTSYDAMVCLAALSNDPLRDLNSVATHSVNLDGTPELARAAKQGGVERFLFSSSCSIHRAACSGAVAEDAKLVPVLPYGESQVLTERDLSLLADDDFSPTYLPNATAYGFSSRLRPATVVNSLTGVATTTGLVRLESDGTRWRPLVHLEDISWAFLAALEATWELVHNAAFSIGAQDNMQASEGAETVRDTMLHSGVSLAYGAGPDLRKYCVDFSKLEENLPELSLHWSVKGGSNSSSAPTSSMD